MNVEKYPIVVKTHDENSYNLEDRDEVFWKD